MKTVRKISNNAMKLPLLVVALTSSASVGMVFALCSNLYGVLVSLAFWLASVVYFMCVYTYWALKDPDRLGTTIYLLEEEEPGGSSKQVTKTKGS